jgi:hypothetical protein
MRPSATASAGELHRRAQDRRQAGGQPAQALDRALTRVCAGARPAGEVHLRLIPRETNVAVTTLHQADGRVKNHATIALRRMPGFGDRSVCGVGTRLHREIPGFKDPILADRHDAAVSGLKSPSLIGPAFASAARRRRSTARSRPCRLVSVEGAPSHPNLAIAKNNVALQRAAGTVFWSIPASR